MPEVAADVENVESAEGIPSDEKDSEDLVNKAEGELEDGGAGENATATAAAGKPAGGVADVAIEDAENNDDNNGNNQNDAEVRLSQKAGLVTAAKWIKPLCPPTRFSRADSDQ